MKMDLDCHRLSVYFAYIISLIIFQLGNWFTTGILSIGTVVGILLLAVMVYLLVRPAPDGKAKR